ncbi:uncharacterized protein LOC132556100 [Ylistrum balloti]|uniref:uncharacterized protein LOC132556100 n=1 Tax=Ylistrum balloti TaxID=509963 RepID=UPI002905DA03|nr:uncharacterized protein LOC132556100 [Ylistrum balloti]
MIPNGERSENTALTGLGKVRKENSDLTQHKLTETRPKLQRSLTLPQLVSSPAPSLRRKEPPTEFQHPLRSPARRRRPFESRIKLPTFKALNRTFDPIPQFIESDKRRNYATRSMDFWERQVKKVVPDRIDLAISNDYQAPPAIWDDRDPYIFSSKSCFYDNKKYVPHRDFSINPEWTSESMHVSEFSPAYRTCPLRYGWCC